MEIKELDKYIVGRGEVRGFIFKQLKSNGYAYLYEVENEGDIYYEVFERRVNTQFETVSYPSAKAFGVWAFCIYKKDKAEAKYEELTEKVKIRELNKEKIEEEI